MNVAELLNPLFLLTLVGSLILLAVLIYLIADDRDLSDHREAAADVVAGSIHPDSPDPDAPSGPSDPIVPKPPAASGRPRRAA